MSVWESAPADGFIKLGDSWVRMSRIQSVTVDETRWGATSSGKDIFKVTVVLIGGATFKHQTTEDAETLLRKIAGVGA